MMFDLRYYQDEAKTSVFAEWEKVQSTAVIAATATGKTELYLSIGVTVPGRVLVLVHRDYLIDQPIRRLAAHGFDDVAVEKAEQRSEGMLQKAKIVFASVQSMCRPNRLATFDPMDFDCVIVDEGHRAVAPTYRRVLDHFRRNPRLRMLILTATPKRKDGIALGTVCESAAYTYGPQQAIRDGWIVPLKFYRREVDGLDFSHVRMRGTDLDPEQVEALLIQEKPLHEVCASLAQDVGATVVFCPGVKVAQAYATLMNTRYRPGLAVMLWQESTAEEREVAGKKLANGEIDYLFNVDIVTEGYDVPELMRVVWAAPTASLVKFTQGTGRVFRTHGHLRGLLTGGREDAESRKLLIAQSLKPFGHVVTYYPQNCKHQLCEPNDILGGEDLPPDVRQAAKRVQEETAAQPGGSDPDEDVETAKAFLELRALLDKRRREIKARASVADTEYDAFGGSRHRPVAPENAGQSRAAAKSLSEDWPPGDAASPKQISWLKWKGIHNADHLGLTKFRAIVVRDLMELGVKPETALSYGKKQALAVRADMQKRGGNDPQ